MSLTFHEVQNDLAKEIVTERKALIISKSEITVLKHLLRQMIIYGELQMKI